MNWYDGRGKDSGMHIPGQEYDDKQGYELVEGEEPEVFKVEFIVCTHEQRWYTETHHLPLPYSDDGCPDSELVAWFENVVLTPNRPPPAFVGVYARWAP